MIGILEIKIKLLENLVIVTFVNYQGIGIFNIENTWRIKKLRKHTEKKLKVKMAVHLFIEQLIPTMLGKVGYLTQEYLIICAVK